MSARNPDWYRATRLLERFAGLRAVEEAGRLGGNQGLGERRLRRWEAEPPFTSGTPLARRLAADGLCEADLLTLLSEPIEAVRDRWPEPPPWLAEFAAAFASSPGPDEQPLRYPPWLRSKSTAGFLAAAEPLVRRALDRIRQEIARLVQAWPANPIDLDTIDEILLGTVGGRLLATMTPTLVLELNVARVQGDLRGVTPEARFSDFVDRLRRPQTLAALYQEYPVLARQLTTVVDQWAAFSIEFLRHLCEDWDELRRRFSPDAEPGHLVAVSGGMGDSHRRGRSVLIAKFGAGVQIVYKPRSLAVDVHFQQLLGWLNDRGAQPAFRTLTVMDRGGYGWTEYVAARPCASPEEVERFYQRQGASLALLYVLDATDFHYENLIAAGEHPVMIDLESLFHPRYKESADPAPEDVEIISRASSVLRVGLLPQRHWGNEEQPGIDLSGLGGLAGQLTPHPVPSLEARGTDEAHLERKRIPIPEAKNRPVLDGQRVDAAVHADAIATGFEAMYRLLQDRREELLAPGGPIRRFADDETRVILRPTRTYGILLRESCHPDVLRDALDADRFLDQLWIGTEDRPTLQRAIAAEREDLANGDTPFFTVRPGSCDLWSSTGVRIPDFFQQSGMASVQRGLEKLSERDLSRQLWFIKASIALLAPDGAHQVPSQRPVRRARPGEAGEEAPRRERLLALARAIGDRIEQLADRSQEEVAWAGLSLRQEREWSVVICGMDLYGGVAGVALFLAHLGALTAEERYTELARLGLRTVRRQIERHRSVITAIGGFSGWGGMIYALVQLAAIWSDPAVADEATAIAALIPPLIERDEALDVIGGSAGCIASLLGHHRYTRSARSLDIAVQCGDRLLERARPAGEGTAWTTSVAKNTPLAGFSHGAAGFSWALAELFAATGATRFRDASLSALAYERGQFSAEAQNWPDLRELDSSGPPSPERAPKFTWAWCHGAPGIGLARLRQRALLDDARLSEEVEVAIKTTLAHGFGHNHSLCHGDLGNVELLLQASRQDVRWAAPFTELVGDIVTGLEQRGWLCGVPMAVETPALMTGLAGIGYQLLRLAEPTRLPSLLMLEGPLR